jgi:hypothetical protein
VTLREINCPESSPLLAWGSTGRVHRLIEVRGKGTGDLVGGSTIRPTEGELDLAEKSAGEPRDLSLAPGEARW